MKNLIKNELIKIYKSKIFLKQLLFILIPILLLSLIEVYLNKYSISPNKEDKNFLNLQQSALTIYGIIFIPFLTTLFFSEVISMEIKFKTNKHIIGSAFSFDRIFIAKFISMSISTVLIIIITMLLEFCLLSTILSINNISANYYHIDYKFAILKSVIIWSVNILYYISLGALGMTLTLFTKSKVFSGLLVLLLLSVLVIIPLPENIDNLMLYYPSKSIMGFSEFRIFPLEVLAMLTISIIYTLIFIIIGSMVSIKKKFF